MFWLYKIIAKNTTKKFWKYVWGQSHDEWISHGMLQVGKLQKIIMESTYESRSNKEKNT